jgi:hypothetical protein
MRNECQARLVRHNPPLVNVIYRKMEKCQNLPDCQPLIMHIVHVAQLLSIIIGSILLKGNTDKALTFGYSCSITI